MLCEKCHHCGLCEGDGTNTNDDSSMRISLEGILPFVPSCSEVQDSKVGFAIDIGTTTIVCSLYALSSERRIATVSQANVQRKYGSDVLSRIQFACQNENGSKLLHDSLVFQINSLLAQSLSIAAVNMPRGSRVDVRKIVITGNTTMLSFALSLNTSSLAISPFTPPSLFDIDITYADVLKDARVNFAAVPLETSVYIPSVISGFIGADTVCAMAALNFTNAEKKIVADIGTNCEMAIQTAKGDIICTSASAGPAFEGGGVSAGMSACEGAIASSKIKSDELGSKAIEYSVIGNGRAKGICGTGLLSVIHSFLTLGFIDPYGTMQGDKGALLLRDGISLLQSDIRSIQLAKAAVRTGLDFLLQYDKSDMPLYLAGGFGTAVNISDVAFLGMIPPFLTKKTIAAGNVALSGAVAILLRDEYRAVARTIVKKAKSINLAEANGFQDSFIANINF